MFCFLGAVPTASIFPSSGPRVHSDENQTYPGVTASQACTQCPPGGTGEGRALSLVLTVSHAISVGVDFVSLITKSRNKSDV